MSLDTIIRKCEQYWNEPPPEAAEFYAILEFIHDYTLLAAQECAALESQIVSTADFLNTCLRESGLGTAQVEVTNLKPGIDALYLKCAALQERVEALEKELASARGM